MVVPYRDSDSAGTVSVGISSARGCREGGEGYKVLAPSRSQHFSFKSFLPCGLERFPRRAEEVSLLIREAFLRGISTRHSRSAEENNGLVPRQRLGLASGE